MRGEPEMAGESTTLAALLQQARRRLASAGVATPDIDARVLISSLLGFDAKDMILYGGRRIKLSEMEVLENALLRRLSGEPVHRIVGWRPFFGLDLALSADTLEPRPDTETLVEAVAPFVQKCAQVRGACRIADLGTGTGAIGLALLSLCADARCVGIDISPGALDVAAANACRAGLHERFTTAESNWFEIHFGRFRCNCRKPSLYKVRRDCIAGTGSARP